MATSGTSTFNRTRDQIIRRAFRLLGAIRSGEVPNAGMVTDAAEALNAMIKRWQASGQHIWTTEEATLFLQVGQNEYSLGSTSTDHATQAYVATALTTNESSGDTVLTLDSTSGMASGDHIGVVLNDSTLHWTTINGAPSGTVTLTDALTDDADQGNAVYAYTTRIERPLRISAARKHTFASANDLDLGRPMSRLDYHAMPNKTTRGAVNQFYYDPRGGASVLGKLHVWPAPDSVADCIKFTWYRSIQIFSVAADTPDFPEEWIDPIAYNLAVEIAAEYDCPADRFTIIKGLANEYRDEAKGWDKEPESVMFGPSL